MEAVKRFDRFLMIDAHIHSALTLPRYQKACSVQTLSSASSWPFVLLQKLSTVLSATAIPLTKVNAERSTRLYLRIFDH